MYANSCYAGNNKSFSKTWNTYFCLKYLKAYCSIIQRDELNENCQTSL